MKRFLQLFVIAAVVAFMVAPVAAQNITNTPEIRTQGLRFLDASIHDALTGSGTNTWTLDTITGTADTSVSYEIVPGCYLAYSYQLNAATDTVNQMVLQGSLDNVNWAGMDSTGVFVGVTPVIKYFDNPDATISAAVNIAPAYFRYIRFVITKDVDEAADATVLTGRVVTSPVPL